MDTSVAEGAKMTRKDYELIAKAVVKLREAGLYSGDCKMVAEQLADSLITTNPRFDRDKFLQACGIED